jgi:hypothetical protein
MVRDSGRSDLKHKNAVAVMIAITPGMATPTKKLAMATRPANSPRGGLRIKISVHNNKAKTQLVGITISHKTNAVTRAHRRQVTR